MAISCPWCLDHIFPRTAAWRLGGWDVPTRAPNEELSKKHQRSKDIKGYGFVWKCWVYSQWNSHLIGIMISKTIGFRGTLFSDKAISKDHPPWASWASYDSDGSPSKRVDKLQKSLLLWDIGLPAWECSVPSKVRQKHQDKLRTLGEEFKTLILIAGRMEVTYYHLVYSVQLSFEDQISALLFLH